MARIRIPRRGIAHEVQVRDCSYSESCGAGQSKLVECASGGRHTVIVGRPLAQFLPILQTQVDRGVTVCADENQS